MSKWTKANASRAVKAVGSETKRAKSQKVAPEGNRTPGSTLGKWNVTTTPLVLYKSRLFYNSPSFLSTWSFSRWDWRLSFALLRFWRWTFVMMQPNHMMGPFWTWNLYETEQPFTYSCEERLPPNHMYKKQDYRSVLKNDCIFQWVSLITKFSGYHGGNQTWKF